MAMVELKLAVAQIARRFELDLVPGQRIEMAAGTTMHPRYGIKMKLRPAARQAPQFASAPVATRPQETELS